MNELQPHAEPLYGLLFNVTKHVYSSISGASFEGGWGAVAPKEKEKRKKKEKKKKRKKEKKEKKERKKEGNYE